MKIENNVFFLNKGMQGDIYKQYDFIWIEDVH